MLCIVHPCFPAIFPHPPPTPPPARHAHHAHPCCPLPHTHGRSSEARNKGIRADPSELPIVEQWVSCPRQLLSDELLRRRWH
eukprot:2483698-Pyramimonas_sp.AAC.1